MAAHLYRLTEKDQQALPGTLSCGCCDGCSLCAKDLQELGVDYTQEQLDQIKRAEEQRLRQRRMEREAKERERLAELYEDCDGRFAFIAGYTDGGAPYGVMWEEVGIDPGLPFEEKVKLYHMQMLG